MEIYFEVLTAGFGDVAPVIQLDADEWKDVNGFNNSNFTLTGSVLSGSDGDVYIEIALDKEIFTAESEDRIKADDEGTFVKLTQLSNGDAFTLSLNMDDYYTNQTVTKDIHLYIYEFSSTTGIKRWTEHNYGFPMKITLTLPICRGQTVPNEVILDDGFDNWVFIGGECQWDGEWKFENGQWIEPSTDDSEDSAEGGSSALLLGGGALVLIVILALTFLFLKKSDSEGMDGMVKDFSGVGGYQQDPVEQYVQQLIAQGYPEETARAYASQYADQAGGASATATAAQPAAASNPAMDAAYQQYYQQFISQGYDQQTAAAYAQQYAAAYIQQQG